MLSRLAFNFTLLLLQTDMQVPSIAFSKKLTSSNSLTCTIDIMAPGIANLIEDLISASI